MTTPTTEAGRRLPTEISDSLVALDDRDRAWLLLYAARIETEARADLAARIEALPGWQVMTPGGFTEEFYVKRADVLAAIPDIVAAWAREKGPAA